MRLQWLGPGLIALALGASFPRTAHAESDGVATAVLGLEGIDTPGGLAEAISEQLRQRVSATHDLRLVSGKDLVELKLVFSCADEAASCIAQAGKSLDAQKLIYGSVKKVGDDFAIWLKLFDVRKEKVETWLTETLAKKETDVPGIKAATAHWFAKLTGRPMNVGAVQITANVYGAVVSLDGVPVGATGELPLTISDLATGKHELVVEKTGHAPDEGAIHGGRRTDRAIQSHASSRSDRRGSAPAGRPVHRGPCPKEFRPRRQSESGYRYRRRAFWLSQRVLGHLGGRTRQRGSRREIRPGRGQHQQRSRSVPAVQVHATTTNPMGICDAKGAPATGLGPADLATVASKSDEGHRDQTLQWICVGVGSALGIASGYLFYKGYLDSDDDKGRKEAHQGLRIFPTAGASSGGILAEFDF